jgi:hypothetical protein
MQPNARRADVPGLADWPSRHVLRLQAEWGTTAAHNCADSPWGGLSAHYGIRPHRLFQIDVGIGLRGIISRCNVSARPECPGTGPRSVPPVAEVTFELASRLVLSKGALRWLPAIGIVGGPSLTTSGSQRGGAGVSFEPLAMEIALTRALGLFFGAGITVGVVGTFCRPCTGAPSCSESTAAGAVAAYQRMGIVRRF